MVLDEILKSLETAAQKSRKQTESAIRDAFRKHFGRDIDTVPDLAEITRYVSEADGFAEGPTRRVTTTAYYQYQGETFLYTREDIETVQREEMIDVKMRLTYRAE